MTKKLMPCDQEIASLADHFRELWTPGEDIRPWLRKQSVTMYEHIHGGWSWASLAVVLTKAGITFRTGTPWTADALSHEAVRANAPLKGYARRRKEVVPSVIHQEQLSKLTEPTPNSPHIETDRTICTAIAPSKGGASIQRFKPAVMKPYAPPRELTTEERAEIDENRKRVLGY
jgi:hypothetical protein